MYLFLPISGTEIIRMKDSPLRQWGHAFKRTSLVRFIRGFFFDGSTIRKAEPDVWQFICDNIRSGWRCIDVGANRGEYSFLMARRTGVSGFVYAFELHPEYALLLQSNIWRYRHRVKVENLAVTDGKTELAEVFPGGSGAEWNIIGPYMRYQNEPPEFYVKATSLDNYFRPDEKIDLVKLDVEGSAQKVLAGMRRILHDWQPLIIIEVHNDSEWEGLKDLEAAEYTLFDLKATKLVNAGNFGFHCVAAPKGREAKFCFSETSVPKHS
jgi:FkbM family methyltransferase